MIALNVFLSVRIYIYKSFQNRIYVNSIFFYTYIEIILANRSGTHVLTCPVYSNLKGISGSDIDGDTTFKEVCQSFFFFMVVMERVSLSL